MPNLCTPMETPKIGGGTFFHHLGLEAWSKLFLAIGPEKEYPKLVLNSQGLSKINVRGSKLVNFNIQTGFVQCQGSQSL